MTDLEFLSRDPDEHHQILLLTGHPKDMPLSPINQISLQTAGLGTLCEIHETMLTEKLSNITPVTHGNALSIYVPALKGIELA